MCYLLFFSKCIILLPSENLEEMLIECPLPPSSRYTPDQYVTVYN